MEEHRKGKSHTQGRSFSFETSSVGSRKERERPGKTTKGIWSKVRI